MPRPRFPYVLKERTRHGKTIWYYRRGKGERIRLPDAYGSPEFIEAYQAALKGETRVSGLPRAAHGTLKWLVNEWMQSSDWLSSKPSTRKQRGNILKHVIDNAGDMPIDQITRRHIQQGKEDRKDTPFAANNFLKVMRALFRWAVDNELMKDNPAATVKMFPPRTEGHAPWNQSDIEKFRSRWPIGTRERLAFEIYYRTGLRRGDVARLGPEHISDGILSIETEKTGTAVYIEVTDEFADLLKKSGLNYNPDTLHYSFARKTIMGMTKESLGNWFREACNAAGVQKSAHGLRKTAAIELAEGGATDKELQASHGWTSIQQSRIYTEQADRKRLALMAQRKRKTPNPDQG